MEHPEKTPLYSPQANDQKDRWIYYAQFRDEDTAVSTGCTRGDDAVRWCEKKLVELTEQYENLTLAEYAKGFCNPDAAFATNRAAHGRALSNGYLDISESFTRNHLLPVWGGWELRDMNAGKLDAWIVELHRRKELAPTTINRLIQALRAILSARLWMAGSQKTPQNT